MAIELLTGALIVITGFYAWGDQIDSVTRPYVNVGLLTLPNSHLFYLRVTNSGKTGARNVRLVLDRDFYQYGRANGTNLREVVAFREPIQQLSPGTEIVFGLAMGPQLVGDQLNPALTPPVFSITATYSYGDRTVTTSPFHRFGVKIKTKGETKRDRRVGHDEEQRLLAAADKLDCAEHAFAGAAMRDRLIGALETGCRLGEMLKIQNRHVIWNTHQISIPAEHAKDAESRRIPFEPKGRLAQLLKRRRFLGPDGFAFGTPTGVYQGTIRTAWESLVLLAHGIEPTRTRARGRVNREQLAEIDLHWHDLRHEAACRWLSRGLDLRAIQLLLGHADLKTTQRYLNVTDEELRKAMQQKLWNRK